MAPIPRPYAHPDHQPGGAATCTPTCITTCVGLEIDLAAPHEVAHSLTVHQVAHALANINRFTGHAQRPISVAEHSLLVCAVMRQTLGVTNVNALMAALLHDAHEVLCGDTTSPAKLAIGPAWHAFEERCLLAVRNRFGVVGAHDMWSLPIRRADLIALATEKRDLLPGSGQWACLDGFDPEPGINLRDRDAFTWQDWRQAFVDRFEELDYCRRNHIAHETDR